MKRQGSISRARARAATAAIAAAAAMLAGSMAAAGEAEVYKWVDENGVVHYSDVPDNARAVETGIRYGRTDTRRVEQQQLKEWERAEAQARQDEADRAEQRAAAQRQAEDRATQSDRCTAARERAQRYASAHRLYEPLPNGDRRYLTDEETSAARKAAELEAEEWCN